MRKNVLKAVCVAMVAMTSMTAITGCNKVLDPKFDTKSSDYIKLGEYKGIVVDVDEDAITKGFVDKRVQSDLDSHTKYVASTDPAKEGDQVTVSFKGTIGGEVNEGFSSNEYSAVLGKDTFNVPGFIEQLYGLKTGETKIFTLVVPDGIKDAESYAGRKIVFDVSVTAVELPVAPMITDAYVKENFSYNTVAEYKAGLANEMSKEINDAIYDKKYNAVMDKLAANCQVLKKPEEQIALRVESLNKSMEFYAKMRGVSAEEYCQQTFGMTIQVFAEKAVIQELIFQEIISAEKLTVDEYYYKGELKSFAESKGYSNAETYVQKVGKDAIIKSMIIQKAIDIVMKNATT